MKILALSCIDNSGLTSRIVLPIIKNNPNKNFIYFGRLSEEEVNGLLDFQPNLNINYTNNILNLKTKEKNQTDPVIYIIENNPVFSNDINELVKTDINTEDLIVILDDVNGLTAQTIQNFKNLIVTVHSLQNQEFSKYPLEQQFDYFCVLNPIGLYPNQLEFIFGENETLDSINYDFRFTEHKPNQNHYFKDFKNDNKFKKVVFPAIYEKPPKTSLYSKIFKKRDFLPNVLKELKY